MSRCAHLPTLLSLAAAVLGCGGEPAPCPAAPAPPTAGREAEPAAVEPPQEPAAELADDRVLVLDGTPDVPPELVERTRQYNNTRSASLASMTDDGTTILVSTRFAETAQLHRVSAPMGAREQLTFLDEPVRGAAFVPGDPRSILYLRDVGGSEDHQIYRLDLSTGRAALLTDGTSKHASYVIAHDGARIAYNGNGRNQRDMDIYVGDGRSPGELLLPREGYWYPIEFSRDGRKLLLGEYVSILDARVHVVDLETRAVTRVTPEQPTAAYLDAAFGSSADEVYVTTDREGEFRELYRARLDRPDAPWTPLTRDVPWNVEQITVSHDGRTVAFTTNEDGYSVLRVLDARTGRTRVVDGVPRGILVGLEAARGAPVLGFSVYGATTAGDAFTYDTRRRRLTRWTRSEMGGLDPTAFVEPTLVRYDTFDDRRIPAFYYRPAGDGPFPVVVDIHGGPESQARTWFSPLTQYLAVDRGFAVLVPNVRGSDGYGKSYLALDDGRLREDSVRDIGALLDWIATRPELDPDRVAVMGGSYGGYMVLASLVHYGDRLRAGVDVVGISSFVTFLENTREYRRDLRRAEYGDERDPEMRAHLTRISPLSHADRIRSALFVAQGANDPRVPASEAEQIVRAVRESGREVWYMLARNEGHGFRRKENRDVYTQLTALFLARHLSE